MCIGSNEPNGPRRCSAHGRQRRDKTAADLAKAQTNLDSLERQATDTRQQIDAIYAEAGVIRNPFTALTDSRYDGLTDEQRRQVQALEKQERDLNDRVDTAAHTVKKCADDARQAQLEFESTREGVAELAAEIDRIAIQYSHSDDPDERTRLHIELTSTMRRLADAEQTMIDQQADRDRRWNTTTFTPPVRGARLGVADSGRTRGDAAAMIAVGTNMSGSYTNTMRPDPDAQATPDSPPEGGAMLRRSRMELVRRAPDGTRQCLVVPIESATGDEHGGPTVTHTLRHAVRTAEAYDADYSTWAKAHNYEPDRTSSEWKGSGSYSEGRAAWKTAGQVHERVHRFLTPAEYQMVRKDVTEEIAHAV